MNAIDISVVVPLHDEAQVLPAFVEALEPVLASLERPFEIVLVDDGSRDDTGRLVDQLADRPGIVGVRLSRNFGKEAAMAAGLEAARGRAVVLMDGDLQHPVQVVPKLVAAWDMGADVVNAVKEDRGHEGLAYRAAAFGFNRLMSLATGEDFERQADFKLLDRSVVDVIVDLPERTRFFRGLVGWVGFRTAEVPFRVADRAAGHTSWSTVGLVTYSLRNLVAFTSLPLRLVAAAGFTVTGLGALLGVQTLWNWARGEAVDGFTTTILSVLIIGGFILLALGVVSLYLSAIYEEVKQRPIYLVRRPPPEKRDAPVP
ncbi:MAG: glycosyltransferase family 2 protein [Myxococcota bacterium]